MNGKAEDRPSLCRELAEVAARYGVILGTDGVHTSRDVERELCHLRDLGFDTYRRLALRLLYEAETSEHKASSYATMAKVCQAISTWITRLWLSGRPLAGLHKAFTELAHGPGPQEDEDPVEFWLSRIRRFWNTRVAVPNDEAVRDGIRSREAYGASATRATKAVLCAMMESEQKGDSPARESLTIEHVMPQKLTHEWRRDLGDEAERVHALYRGRLANLTLSGVNAELGAKSFAQKREIMNKSGVLLTRRIAMEDSWNEATIEHRTEHLTEQALTLWSWTDPHARFETSQAGSWRMRWRFGEGDWHEENYASQMVLKVARGLLTLDLKNADRLRDDKLASNLHLASQYPDGSKVGGCTVRAVPGHDTYVMYPYADYIGSARRCRTMGIRCQVKVDVETRDKPNTYKTFWDFLKNHTAGLPGQEEDWRSAVATTSRLNDAHDRVRIHLTNEETKLYLMCFERKNLPGRAERMLHFSRAINTQLSDQEIKGNDESRSEKGQSIPVCRAWDPEDKDGWSEAATWIKDQVDRLQIIAETFSPNTH